MRVAIQQRINATWVLKFETPNDNINKARKLVGEQPEIIILEHNRDDRYYNKTNLIYETVEEEINGHRRTVVAILFRKYNTNSILEKEYTCPVRNRGHVFSYQPEGKNAN